MRGVDIVLPISAILMLAACEQRPSPKAIVVQQSPDAPASQADAPPSRETRPLPPPIHGPVNGLSEAELARLPFNPTGFYRRADPAGSMRIRSRDGQWEIYVEGRAQWRGGGTPSPCSLLVMGPLEGRTIVAKVTPWSNDGIALYQEDADRANGPLTLVFKGNAVEVTDHASSGFCGLHSDLAGRYVRSERFQVLTRP